MKTKTKLAATKKPVVKDLPAKRSPKGGTSVAEITSMMSNISKSQYETAKGIIANMRA